LVLELEPCTEIDPSGIGRGRVHDGHAVEPLAEKADAPVDLRELLLAVDVLGVLRAVALRRGLRDGTRDGRALAAPKLVELRPKALCAFLRDELRARRARGTIAAHVAMCGTVRYL